MTKSNNEKVSSLLNHANDDIMMMLELYLAVLTIFLSSQWNIGRAVAVPCTLHCTVHNAHGSPQNSPKSIDKELFCDVVLTVGVFKSKVELVIVVLEDILIEPSSLLYLIYVWSLNQEISRVYWSSLESRLVSLDFWVSWLGCKERSRLKGNGLIESIIEFDQI